MGGIAAPLSRRLGRLSRRPPDQRRPAAVVAAQRRHDLRQRRRVPHRRPRIAAIEPREPVPVARARQPRPDHQLPPPLGLHEPQIRRHQARQPRVRSIRRRHRPIELQLRLPADFPDGAPDNCTQFAGTSQDVKCLGDANITPLVPVEQYRNDYIFYVPQTYTYNYIHVTAPLDAKLVLVVYLAGDATEAAR